MEHMEKNVILNVQKVKVYLYKKRKYYANGKHRNIKYILKDNNLEVFSDRFFSFFFFWVQKSKIVSTKKVSG